jgi:hypothetical protein
MKSTSSNKQVVTPPIETAFSMFENEKTECNYIVLAFVVGVLLLAISDAMKR